MLISTLLAEHDNAARRGALARNVGDGFLLGKNPIFGNIRRAALGAGCRFTHDDYCNYKIVPLLTLDRLMTEKKLVYRDNVSVLRELEERRPRTFTDGHLLELEYPRNRLFHESAHLVAEGLLDEAHGQREFILRSMVSESFANTCELVGSRYATSPAHRSFFLLNSLWGEASWVPGLRKALRSGPVETIFELVFLCFLRANFLFAGSSNKIVRDAHARVFGSSGISAGLLKKAAPALAAPFQLSLQFRLVTNRHYFQLVGITGSLQKLLGFSPIKALDERPRMRQQVKSLVAVATR